jgi:hypothetical protein
MIAVLRLTVGVLKEIRLVANYTLLPIHIRKSQMQLHVLAVASTANCHQKRVFFLYSRFIDLVSKLNPHSEDVQFRHPSIYEHSTA